MLLMGTCRQCGSWSVAGHNHSSARRSSCNLFTVCVFLQPVCRLADQPASAASPGRPQDVLRHRLQTGGRRRDDGPTTAALRTGRVCHVLHTLPLRDLLRLFPFTMVGYNRVVTMVEYPSIYASCSCLIYRCQKYYKHLDYTAFGCR